MDYSDVEEDSRGIPARPARRIDTMRRSRDRDGNYAVSRRNDAAEYSNFNYQHEGESHINRRRERQEIETTTIYAHELKRSSDINRSYEGGHYAESPIRIPEGSQRNLAIINDGDAHRRVYDDEYERHDEGRHRRGRSRVSMHDGYDSDGGLDERADARGGGGPPAERHHQLHEGKIRRAASTVAGGTVRSKSGRSVISGNQQGVSKMIRSRSMTSRPAGLSMNLPPHRSGSVKAVSEIIFPIAKLDSRPGTRMSGKSGKSRKSGNTTKAGVVVETMSAPNPFCPDTKGVCCLMILLNLAIFLVAIGFIIVFNLYYPSFVWHAGIFILLAGFLTFFFTFIYALKICSETRHAKPGQPGPGELYWTHHWQKSFALPEVVTGKSKTVTAGDSHLSRKDIERFAEQDRFPEDDLSDNSSRDYPKLYLESDYGQRTDRDADFETDREGDPRRGRRHSSYSRRDSDRDRRR